MAGEQGTAEAGVLAVHPGALAAGVWRPVFDGVPPGTPARCVDLQRDRTFVTAALDPRAPQPTVAALAAVVADAVRAERPRVLVGWSFGGVVAQAALALLPPEAMPSSLVLLDSLAPVPDFTVSGELDPALKARWFGMYICAKQGVSPPTVPVPVEPGAEMLAWCVAAGALRADTGLAGFRKVFEAFVGGLTRNNTLVAGHTAHPHEVPTTLVKPVGSLLPDHGDLGWHQLCPSVSTALCGGDHYSMFAHPVVSEVVRASLHRSTAPTDARVLTTSTTSTQ